MAQFQVVGAQLAAYAELCPCLVAANGAHGWGSEESATAAGVLVVEPAVKAYDCVVESYLEAAVVEGDWDRLEVVAWVDMAEAVAASAGPGMDKADAEGMEDAEPGIEQGERLQLPPDSSCPNRMDARGVQLAGPVPVPGPLLAQGP